MESCRFLIAFHPFNSFFLFPFSPFLSIFISLFIWCVYFCWRCRCCDVLSRWLSVVSLTIDLWSTLAITLKCCGWLDGRSSEFTPSFLSTSFPTFSEMNAMVNGAYSLTHSLCYCLLRMVHLCWYVKLCQLSHFHVILKDIHRDRIVFFTYQSVLSCKYRLLDQNKTSISAWHARIDF